MSETRVVNLRREPYDVYIGRAGKGQDGYFGNPYPVRAYGAEECMRRYREHFARRVDADPEFRRRLAQLRGKRLGCFCRPGPCHGDVIADHLNQGGMTMAEDEAAPAPETPAETPADPPVEQADGVAQE